jgi:hypothetical protein
MLSRILKAKYYPKSDFLHAKPGQNMSYTWRSIQKAGWILKKGGLWTVGNGKSINIWEDNWLLEQEGFKIWAKKKTGTPQTWVNDLILPLSNSWNRGLITRLFYPFEAQQVLNIPITDTNSPDEFCWPRTNDGVYTVKSGYQAIQDWKRQGNNPSTNYSMDEHPIWNTIWNQKIPPKHIHLVWRVLNSGLPMRSNLNTRGINCNPLCPRCHEKIEDVNHAFRDCVWAK